jgi:hypothetical protein
VEAQSSVDVEQGSVAHVGVWWPVEAAAAANKTGFSKLRANLIRFLITKNHDLKHFYA